MSATSVTGRGLGFSNGKYKPENNSRTCCSEEQTVTTYKSKCSIKITSCNKLKTNYSISAIGIKSCNI